MVDVKIKALHEFAHEPTLGTEDAACYDIYAIEDQYVKAWEPTTIRTGIAFEVPRGYRMTVYSRSSNLLRRNAIQVPLIVDADFRGGVLVCWICTKDYQILAGNRVAQVAVEPVIPVQFKWVNELSPTKRGSGGYGSTGR